MFFYKTLVSPSFIWYAVNREVCRLSVCMSKRDNKKEKFPMYEHKFHFVVVFEISEALQYQKNSTSTIKSIKHTLYKRMMMHPNIYIEFSNVDRFYQILFKFRTFPQIWKCTPFKNKIILLGDLLTELFGITNEEAFSSTKKTAPFKIFFGTSMQFLQHLDLLVCITLYSDKKWTEYSCSILLRTETSIDSE